jgi:hypothetical protein
MQARIVFLPFYFYKADGDILAGGATRAPGEGLSASQADKSSSVSDFYQNPSLKILIDVSQAPGGARHGGPLGADRNKPFFPTENTPSNLRHLVVGGDQQLPFIPLNRGAVPQPLRGEPIDTPPSAMAHGAGGSDAGVGRRETPTDTMPPMDRWGLSGLIENIRNSEHDPFGLAVGQDLTTLGIDLNSPE